MTRIAALSLALSLLLPPVVSSQTDERFPEEKGVRSFGKVQEQLLRDQAQKKKLDTEIGPPLLTEVERRPLIPWEKSPLHTDLARTRIAAGAVVKRVSDNELSTLLTENNAPSDTPDNPYVRITKQGGAQSLENRLARRLLARTGTLSPKDVMGAALDVCNNDYWLATLTAHNLLKEVTYAERSGLRAQVGYGKGAGLADNPVLEASDLVKKLQDLRVADDPKVADRMGPWYHAFGLFFVGGITSGTEAQILADAENLTRLLRAGSPPDPGKENVNSWAGRMSAAFNKAVASGSVGSAAQQAPATPQRPPQDLSKLMKSQLERYIESLKAYHRQLQGQLEALPPGADATGNAIRAEQRGVYQDVMRLKRELGARP